MPSAFLKRFIYLFFCKKEITTAFCFGFLGLIRAVMSNITQTPGASQNTK